jgi:hypothetical protein
VNFTTRVLPPDEYPRLAGTEAEGLWPLLPPDSRVIVIEDPDGRIIGCWTLFRPLHAECLWVAPAHRKGSSVFRRLLCGMFTQASAMDAKAVVTASRSDEVTRLLRNFGADELPGRHYTLTIPQRFVCPSE